MARALRLAIFGINRLRSGDPCALRRSRAQVLGIIRGNHAIDSSPGDGKAHRPTMRYATCTSRTSVVGHMVTPIKAAIETHIGVGRRVTLAQDVRLGTAAGFHASRAGLRSLRGGARRVTTLPRQIGTTLLLTSNTSLRQGSVGSIYQPLTNFICWRIGTMANR